MRTALIDFDRSVRDLRAQVRRFRIEESLLSLEGDTVPPEFGQLTQELRDAVEPFAFKQSNYSTAVVLLYGAFERLVDRLLAAAAADRALATPTFTGLPERLRSSHRRRTIEAMADESWQRRAGCSVQDLAEGLHLCESNSPSYRLNSGVFARHRYNYRIESLSSSLMDAGCPQPVLRLGESKRLEGLIAPDGTIIHPTRIFEWVDDLAARRNEVAHGSPSDLLSLDDLELRVLAIWRLGVAIFEILTEDLAHLLRKTAATPLGLIDRVHYKTVAIVDLSGLEPGKAVSVGDLGITTHWTRSRLHVGYGRITSIKRDDVPCEEVRAGPGVVVGVGFSFRLRDGAELSVYERSSPLGWLGDGLPVQEPTS